MIGAESPLLLGSASPRRRALLSELGIPVLVRPAAVDEELRAGEGPVEYLARVVALKLSAVGGAGAAGAGAVLVADTSVVVDGRILGKPQDHEQARRMLEQLVGRAHFVYTRYAIARPDAPSRAAVARTVETAVFMRAAGSDEIARYAATSEGLDKAGAYAVQGIGAFLVERIEGSYSNVVGLPQCEVIADLVALGLLDGFP